MKFPHRVTLATGMLILIAGSASAQRLMDAINRGVVAVWSSTTQMYVGWRLFATDSPQIAFNLYRSTNGGAFAKLNAAPLTATTDFVDSSANPSLSNAYYVRPVLHGQELAPSETFTVPANTPVQQYLQIPLQIPPGGTANWCGTGPASNYTYNANDGSIADVDGDGQNEIVLKWDPSNSQDNSLSGCTGPTILDAYKLDGTLLWRINLGKNIRSGAHYTQFMVYDLDRDGKAELVVKTADGTVDGKGVVIGDPNANWTNNSGYILSGPEYLTVFDGKTGGALYTTNYVPARGSVSSWGDNYGNRVDRFLAGVAYLDGVHPSVVMCRGYYTRATLVAWDWNGVALTQRWMFDSRNPSQPTYENQGDHSLSIADVNGDGKDEIVYGSAVINHEGTGLFSTGWGHGDALHVSRFDPANPDMLVYTIHEGGKPWAETLYNARTGALVVGLVPNYGKDPGRGLISPVDPNYNGPYMWGGGTAGMWNLQTAKATSSTKYSTNFAMWWDADLNRELEDAISITKFDVPSGNNNTLLTCAACSGNNGTKNTPVLSGDIFGDWREEVIWRTADNQYLRIYTTTIPAANRLPTLFQDPQYRLALVWQNVAYNQPPWPSFYIGPGMSAPPAANIVTQASAGVTLNSTIAAKNGPFNGRVWPIGVTNAGPGIAQQVEINNLTLTQTYGTACTPVVLPAAPAYPPAFPVVIGDLDQGTTGNGNVKIDFTGCAATARFTVNVAVSANGGPGAALVRLNQIQ